LSVWGNDSLGILPRQNEKYAVFNETVYSPCDGEIFSVVDEWPNETPGGNKAPYNVGNHVAVRAGDWVVVMGHLQKGSIKVRKGDLVKTGQPLAQVGNSGWTLQPHIHIQAMKVTTGPMWAGEGIPIFFDGKNTVKNTLFFKD
jgi:murein DD-endopeptidase MepM/ murein hydrolase activator NlpD